MGHQMECAEKLRADESRPQETRDFLLGPFAHLLTSNNNGNGNGSGIIPKEALDIMESTYLGQNRLRLASREQDFLKWLQGRCSSTPKFLGAQATHTR